MSIEIGIIGLAKSGKTTVFNALTRGKAGTGSHAGEIPTPNLGVAQGLAGVLEQPKPDVMEYQPTPGFVGAKYPGANVAGYVPNPEGKTTGGMSFEQRLELKKTGRGVIEDVDIDNMNKAIRGGNVGSVLNAFPDFSQMDKTKVRLGLSQRGVEMPMTKEFTKYLDNVKSVSTGLNIIDNLKEQLELVNLPDNILDAKTAGLKNWLLGKTKVDPNAALYLSSVEAGLTRLARALGEVGVITDYDVARILKALPEIGLNADNGVLASNKIENIKQMIAGSAQMNMDVFRDQILIDGKKYSGYLPGQEIIAKLQGSKPMSGKVSAPQGGSSVKVGANLQKLMKKK